MRPRRSSSTLSCSSVNPRTYTDPAHTPSTATNSEASASVDIDAAMIRAGPATRSDPANTSAFGRLRWKIDSSTTPTATPVPIAKMKKPNPAVPAWSTRIEKTGPRGTSMPPPISPVASPTFTARTTGFTKMNCQPSLRSLKARPRSIRPLASERAPSRAFVKIGSRDTMKAEKRNVAESTKKAIVSWSVRSPLMASMPPTHSATFDRSEKRPAATGRVP